VKRLLRRSHVVGQPNMESIQKGFDKHGEPFMLKLLNIITPTEAAFTELIQPKSAILSGAAIDTKTLSGVRTQDLAASNETGKFWSFWDKLLNGIGSTGEALGKFKNDIAADTANPEYTQQQAATIASNTKILYMVAAGFVALIILILILRK
jgi:hypothetical protein